MESTVSIAYVGKKTIMKTNGSKGRLGQKVICLMKEGCYLAQLQNKKKEKAGTKGKHAKSSTIGLNELVWERGRLGSMG